MRQIILTLFLMVVAVFAVAADTGDRSVEGPLIIAVSQDSYPYQFRDPDTGEAAGLLVDLWRSWSKRSGIPVQFRMSNWSDSLQMVMDGRADMHAGMSYNENRAKRLTFADPMLPVRMNLFVHHSLEGVYSLADLRPFRIGVLEKSNHATALASLIPNVSLAVYPSRAALYRAIAQGDLKVFAGLDRVSPMVPHAEEIERAFPNHRKYTYGERALLPAVSKQNEFLIPVIRQGMSAITRAERAEINRRWLGVSSESKAIQIAVLPDAPPYMMLNDSGEATGLYVDIWRLWAQKAGYSVEFKPLAIRQQLSALDSGLVDIIAAFPSNDEVTETYATSPSLMSLRAQVFVSGDEIQSMKDLQGKVLGVFPNSTYLPQIRYQYPKLDLRFFATPYEMLKAIEAGEIDAFAATTNIVEHLLIQRNQAGEFRRLAEPSFQIEIVSLLSADNQNLLERVTHGLNLLEHNELMELENRWVLTPEDRHFENQPVPVQLSAEEKAWVQRAAPVRFGAVRSYPPFEFVDEAGHFSGIHADLMEWLSQRTGLSFEVVLFDSWQQALQAIADRKVDLLASVTVNEKRKAFVNFTRAYWPTPWAVAMPEGSIPISRLAEFEARDVAIVQGYEVVERLERQFPLVAFKAYPDTTSALDAVLNGDVDAYFNNLTTLVAQLRGESLPMVKLATLHDVEPDYSHLAVRKDQTVLASILDKAVAQMGENERRRIMFKWLKFNIEQGVSVEQIWRVGLQISTVVVVLIGLMWFWNRRLKREIELRRRVEHQMKHMASHDELTKLPNRRLLEDRLQQALSIHSRSNKLLAVMFLDLDGFKEINDRFGHEVGDTLLIDVVQRISSNVRRSDTLARFGGDEFVLLATNLEHRLQAAELARKLMGCLEAPFEVSDDLVQVSASIGVSLYPIDGKNAAELLRAADHLMYEVKGEGKQAYRLSSPSESQEMTLDPV